jgi:transcriptional regulator with XRE-family HTH domain
MDATKRKALRAAGWKIGDAADFLEMNDFERQLLEVRVQLALAIRRQREASQMSQKELGAKLKTSQPRVAKIERAAPDVSLDQLVRAFAAAGGKFSLTLRKPSAADAAKTKPRAARRTAISAMASAKKTSGNIRLPSLRTSTVR